MGGNKRNKTKNKAKKKKSPSSQDNKALTTIIHGDHQYFLETPLEEIIDSLEQDSESKEVYFLRQHIQSIYNNGPSNCNLSNEKIHTLEHIAIINPTATFLVLEKETLTFFRDVRSCLLSDMRSSTFNSTSVLNHLKPVLTMWNRVDEAKRFVKGLFEMMHLDTLCDVLFYEVVLSNTEIEVFLENILQSKEFSSQGGQISKYMKEQMVKMKKYLESLNADLPYLKSVVAKYHLEHYKSIIPTTNDILSVPHVNQKMINEESHHIISNERLSLANSTTLDQLGLHRLKYGYPLDDNNNIQNDDGNVFSLKRFHRNDSIFSDVQSRIHIEYDIDDLYKISKIEKQDEAIERIHEQNTNPMNYKFDNNIVIGTSELEKLDCDDLCNYFNDLERIRGLYQDSSDSSNFSDEEDVEDDFDDYTDSSSFDEYVYDDDDDDDDDNLSHYNEDEEEEEEFDDEDDVKYSNYSLMNRRNMKNKLQINNIPKVEETRSVEELLKFIEGDDVNKKNESKAKKKKKKKKKKSKSKGSNEPPIEISKTVDKKDTLKSDKLETQNKDKAELKLEPNNKLKPISKNKAENKIKKDKVLHTSETIKKDDVHVNGHHVNDNSKKKHEQKNDFDNVVKEQKGGPNTQRQIGKKANKTQKVEESQDDEEIELFLKKLELSGNNLVRETVDNGQNNDKKSNFHLENLAQWAREDRRNKFKYLYENGNHV